LFKPGQAVASAYVQSPEGALDLAQSRQKSAIVR